MSRDFDCNDQRVTLGRGFTDAHALWHRIVDHFPVMPLRGGRCDEDKIILCDANAGKFRQDAAAIVGDIDKVHPPNFGGHRYKIRAASHRAFALSRSAKIRAGQARRNDRALLGILRECAPPHGPRSHV